MVTISLKGLWIVTIGLTVLYFVPVNYPIEMGGLASFSDLIYIGLILLWIAAIILTIVYVVGKAIARKIKNS